MNLKLIDLIFVNIDILEVIFSIISKCFRFRERYRRFDFFGGERKEGNDRKEEARNKRREEDKSVAALEEVCLALGLSEATATATTAADGGRYGINA